MDFSILAGLLGQTDTEERAVGTTVRVVVWSHQEDCSLPLPFSCPSPSPAPLPALSLPLTLPKLLKSAAPCATLQADRNWRRRGLARDEPAGDRLGGSVATPGGDVSKHVARRAVPHPSRLTTPTCVSGLDMSGRGPPRRRGTDAQRDSAELSHAL
ncbi:hypothetical protein DPEC_G00183420 [Dallia pectoralis]|uniref:Uncharacterized protein n=1 Tax=Dallia pectoralis TaxID=75939 RepID=A0ACC2GAN2_DALPE|nr:hypothetical protein DPEC_G00183420 [Dallia pectoralis]